MFEISYLFSRGENLQHNSSTQSVLFQVRILLNALQFLENKNKAYVESHIAIAHYLLYENNMFAGKCV
jgi:hypothetical protein